MSFIDGVPYGRERGVGSRGTNGMTAAIGDDFSRVSCDGDVGALGRGTISDEGLTYGILGIYVSI